MGRLGMYDSPAVPSVQTLPALQGSPTWGPMLLSAPHIMEETLHTLPVGLLVLACNHRAIVKPAQTLEPSGVVGWCTVSKKELMFSVLGRGHGMGT